MSALPVYLSATNALVEMFLCRKHIFGHELFQIFFFDSGGDAITDRAAREYLICVKRICFMDFGKLLLQSICYEKDYLHRKGMF